MTRRSLSKKSPTKVSEPAKTWIVKNEVIAHSFLWIGGKEGKPLRNVCARNSSAKDVDIIFFIGLLCEVLVGNRN